MAQTTVSIRMDDNVKKEAEWFCHNFGMTLSTAVTIFAKAIIREHRIPFEIRTDEDPFYSEANMRYLKEAIENYHAGRGESIYKTMAELEAMANE